MKGKTILHRAKGRRNLSNEPSESELVKIWQHQLMDRTELVTEEGEPIKVIYPGRANDDQGADFRDAVIATSRGLTMGDVEVHIKSGHWQAHHHHIDAAYNRVILHVVMWHNQNTATNLQNGCRVPVLALHRYVRTPVSQWFNLNCQAFQNIPCAAAAQRRDRDTLENFIEKAGEERFLTRAAKFKTDLSQSTARQILYQGIMVALGYARNKLPFAELAHRLPLQTLELVSREPRSDEECLAEEQAILLGTAGLLTSPFKSNVNHWVGKLERIWTAKHRIEAMSYYDWQLFKVRPNNSPIRRLVAMSHLLVRYRQQGLLDGLISLVKEAPAHQGWHKLEEGLIVNGSAPGALLGRARAADIIVNVLLPFSFAFAQSTAQPELESKARRLYSHYPSLAGNSIERHMINQFGLKASLINSARRQQGLIHIYKSFCTQGKCGECGLSQP